MIPQVEKKRAFIINFVYLAIILGLVFVFFKYLFWLTAPFLLSFLFAVILQKPIRFLDRKTKKQMPCIMEHTSCFSFNSSRSFAVNLSDCTIYISDCRIY
ncbi:hypothetical protein IMSAG250_00687 [Clostridiales bacterium]|nr:hypothetical protein IMSAG250_00687 [Clostridiales bacterium]